VIFDTAPPLQRLTHADFDFSKNRHRIFGPRIVGREHDDITVLDGSPSHLRTFAAVTITAAPEHRNDPVRLQGLRRRQQTQQRIFRMRIVHDDGKILARRHTFEATRYIAHPRHGLLHLITPRTSMKRHTHRT
jgi:hypothetical protein